MLDADADALSAAYYATPPAIATIYGLMLLAGAHTFTLRDMLCYLLC